MKCNHPQVVHNVEKEKIVSDVEFDNEQCEQRHCHSSRSNDFIAKDCTSPVRLGSTGEKRDTGCSSSWLSLNSCPPGRPPRSKDHCMQSCDAEGPVLKNQEPPQLNQSSKKTTPIRKYVAAQRQPMNMSPPVQLGQDPQAVIPVRKPRKRSVGTHLIPNPGMIAATSEQGCNNEPGSHQQDE